MLMKFVLFCITFYSFPVTAWIIHHRIYYNNEQILTKEINKKRFENKNVNEKQQDIIFEEKITKKLISSKMIV